MTFSIDNRLAAMKMTFISVSHNLVASVEFLTARPIQIMEDFVEGGGSEWCIYFYPNFCGKWGVSLI